jgi:hypothetical protein
MIRRLYKLENAEENKWRKFKIIIRLIVIYFVLATLFIIINEMAFQN